MRTGKGIWMGLVMAALMVFAAQQADARTSSTTGGTIFDSYVNKQAKGTKMFGPLTIYYEEKGSFCPDGDPLTNMHVFLRLRKGSDLYAFSDVIEDICYFDTTAQITAIDQFIRTVVVPPLFGITTNAVDVKSVEEVADCPEPMCFPVSMDGPYFTILDIEIAVQP